jgi:hypothetical protein
MAAMMVPIALARAGAPLVATSLSGRGFLAVAAVVSALGAVILLGAGGAPIRGVAGGRGQTG